MKNYDYNFTNSCWGSHIEALKKAFTKTGELYAVTANGWYFSYNVLFIGKTFQECLDFIECTPEEYEYQLTHYYKHHQGFWNYEIKKLNLEDLLNKVIEEEIWHAKQNWESKQTEEVIRPRAEKLAKEKINDFLDNFYSQLVEKIRCNADDLMKT